jgi:hypothetical protein
MNPKLKPGDRVRIATNFPLPGYQPGDKGTVLTGPILRPNGQPYYIVAMDAASRYTPNAILGAEEIEPDA